MEDDGEPFYAPGRRPPPPREAVPGIKVWELRKGERIIVCELRDDELAGAGIDLQILDGSRWPLFTQRCETLELVLNSSPPASGAIS